MRGRKIPVGASMLRLSITLALVSVLAGACGPAGGNSASTPDRYALGRDATPAQLAAFDRDVGPDGVGLPAGSGTVAQGTKIFAAKCASCHGAKGEGMAPAYPELIGRPAAAEGFKFGSNPGLDRTIGNYWPYATTVFDYVRRAMPQLTPGTLTDNEVYALTAFLLAANAVIPEDATLDAVSLPKVQMPYRDKFVPDNRRGGREVK